MMKKLNEFIPFKINELELVNGGLAMSVCYTQVFTNCGTENEDEGDKDEDE